MKTLTQALALALYGAVCGYFGYISNAVAPQAKRALAKCEIRYEAAMREIRMADYGRPRCKKEF